MTTGLVFHHYVRTRWKDVTAGEVSLSQRLHQLFFEVDIANVSPDWFRLAFLLNADYFLEAEPGFISCNGVFVFSSPKTHKAKTLESIVLELRDRTWGLRFDLMERTVLAWNEYFVPSSDQPGMCSRKINEGLDTCDFSAFFGRSDFFLSEPRPS